MNMRSGRAPLTSSTQYMANPALVRLLARFSRPSIPGRQSHHFHHDSFNLAVPRHTTCSPRPPTSAPTSPGLSASFQRGSLGSYSRSTRVANSLAMRWEPAGSFSPSKQALHARCPGRLGPTRIPPSRCFSNLPFLSLFRLHCLPLLGFACQ
ncbi:hypothetical protein LZ30DRAFT_180850 [Colletotrichum cereale]|nr:hypothetical protein LZ30DRAFT_180850 [Colletotrichum cereale]